MNNNSVFERLAGVLREMVITGEKAGATPEFYGVLAHNRILFDYLVSMVMWEGEYPVSFQGDSWRKLVSNLDYYAGVDDSDFKVIESGFYSIHLIRSSESSPGQVLSTISRRGFRPASNYELISLCRQHPNLQRYYKIIAPRRRGGVLVLQTSDELRGSGPERVLNKYAVWPKWNSPEIRFAVVSKV